MTNWRLDLMEKRIAAVQALDLSVLVEDLVRGGKTRDRSEWAVGHYREFLATIAAYPDATLVPAKAIDEVWHAHMCRPVKYARDCMVAFGKIVDHTPGVFGTDEYKAAYDLTRKLVSFGAEMPANYADGADAMAGAECFRRPSEPGEDPEDPLGVYARAA